MVSDTDESIDPNVRTIKSLSDSAAFDMAAYVRSCFWGKFRNDETPRGCFVVLGCDSRVLIETPMGDWLPRNKVTAYKKARTAWFLTRNTSEISRMNPEVVRAHGRNIETTFAGGVCLYEDKECTVFLGVAAFSGIPRDTSDEALVAEAAQRVNVYTKVVLADS